ncbi:DoxX family protein [Rubrivirga sp.]|uniref:DoxX family protein n=1 Tax=Rubrivirga sp. TaxID=1885344 RepID=UPI003C720757
MKPLFSWAESNRSAALDVVRIYLGIGLAIRGVTFLADPSSLADLIPSGSESPFATLSMAHYVGLSHLVGGLFLALGIATRVAAAVQVPALAGAAFLVHLPESGILGQSFAFSAFVLALLLVFVVWGSGQWSLDRAVEGWSERQRSDEEELVATTAQRLRARPRLPLAPPRAARASSTETPCECEDRDRHHPHAKERREYGGLSGLRFITGTHARPTRVVFRCTDCDGVIEVIEAPEDLDAFRYEQVA